MVHTVNRLSIHTTTYPSLSFFLAIIMAKDKSEKKDKKRKETKEVTETVKESIEVNDDVEMDDAELVKVRGSHWLTMSPNCF